MTDEELIMFCAFRYALGRRTYIVEIVANYLQMNLKGAEAKKAVIKEIDEAEKRGEESLGMWFDRGQWLRLKRNFERDLAEDDS